MSIMRRVAVAAALLTVMAIAAGCPKGVHISDIQQDPGRYYNKEVGIKGTVVSSFGAMGTGMYEVDDGTGRIWVMTQTRGVPAKGAKVGVAGNVVPTITFGGRSFATVLKETDRR